MEDVFNLHLYMGASSGFLVLWMLPCLWFQGIFREELAIHTEEVDYVVNGKVVNKETWIVQKWSR